MFRRRHMHSSECCHYFETFVLACPIILLQSAFLYGTHQKSGWPARLAFLYGTHQKSGWPARLAFLYGTHQKSGWPARLAFLYSTHQKSGWPARLLAVGLTQRNKFCLPDRLPVLYTCTVALTTTFEQRDKLYFCKTYCKPKSKWPQEPLMQWLYLDHF